MALDFEFFLCSADNNHLQNLAIFQTSPDCTAGVYFICIGELTSLDWITFLSSFSLPCLLVVTLSQSVLLIFLSWWLGNGKESVE